MPSESLIPAEAVQAVVEGVDHESIERHGLDRPAILAILRAAAPFLAGAETARAKALHSRDDSNPRGPWCGTCTTPWPCRTWIALLPDANPRETVEQPARPLGTLQDVRPVRDGMSGRSDDPQGAASLSEPQPWEGSAVVLVDGQEIPIRAGLTIQPAAWSITAHLNPADELYLPLGSCVVRLPDGREGAAVVTSVQNGVCGSLSGVGPPPTSKPLPALAAEEKPGV